MIDLYTWTTPNGRKASIMLEETGLPYTVHPIDISKDEQFAPDFLKISPNNKIPAIVDQDTGASLMEFGRHPSVPRRKDREIHSPGWSRPLEDVAMADVPDGWGRADAGAGHHFLQFNPGKAPYAEERFRTEARRLYSVMDKRLGEAEYLAGDDYTIADIATWPWISRFEWQGIDLAQFPNVRRWYLTIAGRPGVQRGYDVPKKGHEIPLA